VVDLFLISKYQFGWVEKNMINLAFILNFSRFYDRSPNSIALMISEGPNIGLLIGISI